MESVKTVLERKPPSNLLTESKSWKETIEREHHPEWKLKRIAAQIVMSHSHHARSTSEKVEQDPAAILFGRDYSMVFLDKVLSMISVYPREFVPPKCMVFCLKTVANCMNIKSCMENMKGYLEQILCDLCTPMLIMNEKDQEYWTQSPEEFIYSNYFKGDDHNMIKNAAEDLITKISSYRPGRKDDPVLYMYVSFICTCLSTGVNPRTNEKITPMSKEYLLHGFEAVTDLFKTDKKVRAQLESFCTKFIVDEMLNGDEVLKFRSLSLYSKIGYFFSFSSQEINVKVVQAISSCLRSKNLPVQIAAAEALGVLLGNPAVQDMLKQDLIDILKLILELMEKVDFEGLVVALENIIQNYQSIIAPHSDEIISGVGQAYYSYKRNATNSSLGRGGNQDEEEAVDSSERAAQACLHTMANLLKANLKEETYYKCTPHILEIFANTIIDGDEYNFTTCLSLINLLVYKNKNLSNDLVFFYPIITYLITGKPKSQIQADISIFPDKLQDALNKVDAKLGWMEDVAPIVACMLNFVQKMGRDFLNSKDCFGKPFVELLFEVVKKIGEECLRIQQNYELIYALKLATGLLENLKGQVDQHLPSIVKMLNDLSSIQDLSNSTLSAIYSLESVCLWYNAERTLSLISSVSDGKLLISWFENMHLYSSQNEREKKILALTALISLPKEAFPQNLNLQALVNEVYKSSKELLEMKQYDRDSDAKSDKSDYEDLYDDEDELWDEDDEFQDDQEVVYDSPLYNVCSICCLKKSLENIEKHSPEKFKEIISCLCPNDQDGFARVLNEAEILQNS